MRALYGDPVSTSRRLCALTLALCAASLLAAALGMPYSAAAIGARSAIEIRTLHLGGKSEVAIPRPSAARRLAWAVRQRTSVKTRLEPRPVKLGDASMFEAPMLYWPGEREFAPLTEAQRTALRRFVEFGGFVLIDDAAPDDGGFDRSVRRELAAIFGDRALHSLPATHTIYRSFYLIDRPVGRVEGPPYVEAIERGGRAAIIYSRHDLGGAWARDNLGNFLYQVTPGHSGQRERAFRLGVNLVMYALCLDYKDDQVHAPFIMRRRAGRP